MRTQESVPENWAPIVESFRKEYLKRRPQPSIISSLFNRGSEERTSRSDDLDILGMTEEECGGEKEATSWECVISVRYEAERRSDSLDLGVVFFATCF